jgi:hypothetical protein
MRRILMAAGVIGALTLGACSSGEETASPASPAATASASADSPTARPSQSPSSSASASATPARPPSPIPASIIGLHVAGVQDGAWPDPNVPIGSLRLWDSGTGWGQIETSPGRYSWAQLDEAVANAEEHGVTDILLVLGTTPAWNAKRIDTGDYPAPGAASAPKDLDAWDEYVAAVVDRYRGRISSYQIWNEASLSMFWDGTPRQMAELTDRAYRIIKDVDPGATVVAASTTVRLEGAFDRFFVRYLEALRDLDWPVDAFSAHLYPASRATTDERATFIAQVTDALAAVGAPDLPVWDTELNYGLAGPGSENPRQAIVGSRARDWVVETTMDSLALGISRTYWYIWTPEPYDLLGMQLTDSSGAVTGLRVVEQWLVGGELGPCTQATGIATCAVTKNGVPAMIAWSLDGPGALPPPAGFTEVCRTDNECTTIDGVIELDETPVRLLP